MMDEYLSSTGRRGLLALLGLGACADPGAEVAALAPAVAAEPLGLALFSVDFVAGAGTGLPARSQLSLVLGEDAQAGPRGVPGRIARTLQGPGRLAGADVVDGGRSVTRFCAVGLPARPHSLGRVYAEPFDTMLGRTIFILPPLLFTPVAGQALYLGNIAILPHTWSAVREPHISPASHRALRDMWARDEAPLRVAAPGLVGMRVLRLERPTDWPAALPPREAWPDGIRPAAAARDQVQPQFYGPPGRPLAPPGTPVRSIWGPAPPPGFGPPGVAPGRFGAGAAPQSGVPLR